MNIRTILSGLTAAVLAAVFAVPALAQSTDTDEAEASVWREAQPVYEFKHPLKVTCQEFLDTEQIYRPYVVAWLSGRAVGVLDVGDPDEFVPVSVPQMVTLCEEQPDELVWELVRVQ